MKMFESFLKLICITFLLTQLSFAQTPSSVTDMVKGMKLDKPQIAKMLDLLVQSGKITKKQADDAKKELEKLDDKKLQEIKDKAVFKLDNGMHKIPDMRDEKTKAEEEVKKKNAVSGLNTTATKKDAKKEDVNLQETLNYLNN
jgi:hypothetical protein